MKQSSRSQWFLSGAVLLSVCDMASPAPYDENLQPVIDGTIQKTMTPLKQSVSVDDALIRLGRAADVDIIADVTDVPADAKAKPYPATPAAIAGKWEPIMGNVMFDLAAQAGLSQLRYDTQTFLFWREPELLPLAREIIAEGRMKSPGTSPDSRAIFATVADYARRVHGWKGDKTLSLEVPLSQLPPPLQTQLLAFKRNQDLKRDLRLELWLSDDFWKKARLMPQQISGDFTPDQATPDAPVTVLQVKGFDERNQPISDMFSVRLEVR